MSNIIAMQLLGIVNRKQYHLLVTRAGASEPFRFLPEKILSDALVGRRENSSNTVIIPFYAIQELEIIIETTDN